MYMFMKKEILSTELVDANKVFAEKGYAKI